MVETINKNNILNKIRSKYIKIKTFEYLNQNRLLNIINFNSNSSTDMFWMFIGCSTNLSLICKDELIKKEYEDYLLNKY